MTENKDENMTFTIRLDGNVLDIFKRIQEGTGLKRKAEVIRYIIKLAEKYEKEHQNIERDQRK